MSVNFGMLSVGNVLRVDVEGGFCEVWCKCDVLMQG